ncbi:hypothetical protein [Mycetocola sp.]|uniref:hypothetical protein n=1 Tax=Mycetocola sp. TaxID=1871042 RepID=UPI0039899D3A
MAGKTTASTSDEPVEYEVLIGINYPPNKRAEPGDVVTDLPYGSKALLLEVGAIKQVTK